MSLELNTPPLLLLYPLTPVAPMAWLFFDSSNYLLAAALVYLPKPPFLLKLLFMKPIGSSFEFSSSLEEEEEEDPPRRLSRETDDWLRFWLEVVDFMTLLVILC